MTIVYCHASVSLRDTTLLPNARKLSKISKTLKTLNKKKQKHQKKKQTAVSPGDTAAKRPQTRGASQRKRIPTRHR